jgi:hypothetical protein
MVTFLFALVSILVFRFRSRTALELKLVALQHQLAASSVTAISMICHSYCFHPVGGRNRINLVRIAPGAESRNVTRQ